MCTLHGQIFVMILAYTTLAKCYKMQLSTPKLTTLCSREREEEKDNTLYYAISQNTPINPHPTQAKLTTTKKEKKKKKKMISKMHIKQSLPKKELIAKIQCLCEYFRFSSTLQEISTTVNPRELAAQIVVATLRCPSTKNPS